MEQERLISSNPFNDRHAIDVELEVKSGRQKISTSRRLWRKRDLIEKILVEEKKHIPVFTYFITFVDIVMMIVALIYNGGFEPFKNNFWLGPSIDTLVSLGAKDAVLMIPKYGGHQYWRFITPMFLHVGVLHLFLNMLAQVPIGRELERNFGTARVVFIYIISGTHSNSSLFNLVGIGGNLLSVLFLPSLVEVGASSSLYGWISIYIVDYLVNWKFYRRPGRQIIFWSIGAILSLVLGLLPGVDNFAHLGGSICGAFGAMIVMPRIFEIKEHPMKWAVVRGLGAALLFFFFAFGFAVFFDGIDVKSECNWCKYFSCLPFWKEWCE